MQYGTLALATCLTLSSFLSATAADFSNAGPLYGERYRPQFHFTAQKNWLNDPNGMVFYKGEYHLFFQWDPNGRAGGVKAWGHAVGSDLLHWTELTPALLPDELGPIWSGSAVVDWNNTSGFQTGDEKPIVCMYTSAGNPFGQSIAYSNDRGRTWTKYDKNPVLPHISGGNRDPKVLWHEPSHQWIMALYLDDPKRRSDYALFGSPDLKQWNRLCTVTLPGNAECPDFFELPIDGNVKNTRWVLWGANNSYMLGTFDGRTFTQETGAQQTHFGANRYAAQTFSDMPGKDGRRIQIAWMNWGDPNAYRGMPFTQQMSFPVELTLRQFPEGLRVCSLPVKELEKLHEKRHAWSGALKPGDNPLAGVTGELFDIRLDIAPEKATEITLKIRGVEIQYKVKSRWLVCQGRAAIMPLIEGRLQLQVLVDRTSIEIFSADGRVNMAYCFMPPDDDASLSLSVRGGEATARTADVWTLRSIWPSPAAQ